MTAESSLADRVWATTSADLLPARLTLEGSAIPTRLELWGAAPLDTELQLLVLGSDGDRFVVPAVDDGVSVRRAVAGDGAAETLLRLIAQEDPPFTLPFHVQRFSGAEPVSGERAMLVDQTHESVVVGDRAVVKWMVKSEPTPAPVLMAHLVSNDFTAMPHPWALVTWNEDDRSILVASVTQFLAGATDGWQWCVDDVGRATRGSRELAASLTAVAQLGVLVADFHSALATPSEVIPHPVRQAERSTIASWLKLARSLLGQATERVSGDAGDRLRTRRGRIEQAITGMEHVQRTPMMPIHGDLHVGQILRWDGGYAINDFDGNPVLPPEERTSPQAPARDVAGMLQSLDHVGRVVVQRVPDADPSLALRWIVDAQGAFLTSYLSRMTALGQEGLFDRRLLLPFQVEQELREFLYAENHLPRWQYVPDGAMCSLFP